MTAIAVQADIVVPDFDTSQQGTQLLVEAAKNYRDSHNNLTGLVRRAFLDNWYVEEFELSQSGWEAYLSKYIGPALGGIKGIERVKLVTGFTAIGMSTRVQAAVLGVSKDTINREQHKAAVANETPNADEEPTSVKGADGKTYSNSAPKTFSCTHCTKRKPFDSRVELDEGLVCETCAEKLEAAAEYDEDHNPRPAVKVTASQAKLQEIVEGLDYIAIKIAKLKKTAGYNGDVQLHLAVALKDFADKLGIE